MSDKRQWATHTADGSLARIYETSGSDPDYPIVGEVRNTNGKWFLAKWTAEGVFYNHCIYYNLVPPGTPRIERFKPPVNAENPPLVLEASAPEQGWYKLY